MLETYQEQISRYSTETDRFTTTLGREQDKTVITLMKSKCIRGVLSSTKSGKGAVRCQNIRALKIDHSI